MARPASPHPTELELEILKILWRDGPAVVQHVRDALAPERKLAYSSVITIMNIMTDKGYLSRVKDGKGYRYKARIKAKRPSGRFSPTGRPRVRRFGRRRHAQPDRDAGAGEG